MALFKLKANADVDLINGAGTLGVIFLILAFVGLGIETFKE